MEKGPPWGIDMGGTETRKYRMCLQKVRHLVSVEEGVKGVRRLEQ